MLLWLVSTLISRPNDFVRPVMRATEAFSSPIIASSVERDDLGHMKVLKTAVCGGVRELKTS